MDEVTQEFLDEFNDGELDSLLSYFENMNNILLYFKKRNVLHLIDPFSRELEDYQTEILNYLINNLGDKSMMKYIVSQLSDVEVKEDGYYLQLSDKSDLSGLFKDYGSETSPRDVVKALFNDDNWEHFSNTTDDIYDDVIEVLTPENIERLKTHILDTLTNWKIEVEEMQSPDLFVEYADDEGIFHITPENVGDVIGDKESFMYLLDEDYLPNVTGDLYSIHYNAYNQAYESEIYEDVMSELETFFDVTTSKWISVPSSVNPERLREFYEIRFKPNEVVNSIKKYVSDKNNWGYYAYNIDYMSTWLTLMDSLMDNGEEPWLNFRIPDYADSTLTKKYINEIFPDYI
jgi:hypothetical protein